MADIKVPSKKELEAMSADDLEGLLRDMNNAQAEGRKAILEVHAVYDKKRDEEEALRKLGNLSDGEVEALLTVVKAGGIPSRDEEEADES